jgi:hypothetical protein
MAEQIPSPSRDNVEEALNNPAQVGRRIREQDVKLQQQDTPTSLRPTDAPAAPNMTDYIKKGK